MKLKMSERDIMSGGGDIELFQELIPPLFQDFNDGLRLIPVEESSLTEVEKGELVQRYARAYAGPENPEGDGAGNFVDWLRRIAMVEGLSKEAVAVVNANLIEEIGLDDFSSIPHAQLLRELADRVGVDFCSPRSELDGVLDGVRGKLESALFGLAFLAALEGDGGITLPYLKSLIESMGVLDNAYVSTHMELDLGDGGHANEFLNALICQAVMESPRSGGVGGVMDQVRAGIGMAVALVNAIYRK